MKQTFKEDLWEIANSYIGSEPKSGSWETEAEHEQRAIADHFRISMDQAKQLMIEELGFEEDLF